MLNILNAGEPGGAQWDGKSLIPAACLPFPFSLVSMFGGHSDFAKG